jgi:hypothetical protein
MSISLSQPNVLVVEGREDELFFTALIAHLRLNRIQVMPIGGKTNLRKNLMALAITPGFSNVISLGIARDADLDPNSAFQSVSDALQAAGLPNPTSPLVTVGQRPRVTVMILPEPGISGILEDLCLNSVAGDSAVPCVHQYFQCLEEREIPLPLIMSKAKVQVFLASKRKTLRLGEAAQAGYWPFNHKAFAQVGNFLRQICSQTTIA